MTGCCQVISGRATRKLARMEDVLMKTAHAPTWRPAECFLRPRVDAVDAPLIGKHGHAAQ